MDFLSELEELLIQRKNELPEGSYTAKLFKGPDKQLLKKIVEEAGEVTLALAQQPLDKDDALDEAADLIFHLLLGLVAKDIRLEEVVTRLNERHSK